MSDHGHAPAASVKSHPPSGSGGGKDSELIEGTLALTVVAVPGLVAGILLSWLSH